MSSGCSGILGIFQGFGEDMSAYSKAIISCCSSSVRRSADANSIGISSSAVTIQTDPAVAILSANVFRSIIDAAGTPVCSEAGHYNYTLYILLGRCASLPNKRTSPRPLATQYLMPAIKLSLNLSYLTPLLPRPLRRRPYRLRHPLLYGSGVLL